MRVSWTALSLGILLMAPSNVLGQSSDEKAAYSLVIPFTKIEHIPTQEALAGPCLTDKPIFACTRFGGRRLDCRCERDGDRWRITAHAQFLSFIYLSESGLLRHERLHIEDVKTDVKDYLQNLSIARFDSSNACEERARDASRAFPAQMEKLQMKSNATRHPVLFAREIASLGPAK